MLRKIKMKFCYLAFIVVKWGHCQDMDHLSCFYTQLHTKTLQKTKKFTNLKKIHDEILCFSHTSCNFHSSYKK